MVCTVNHATEDLQHRILDYSKYRSLHCHVQMEREERLRRQREQYRAREKQKSNRNPGWQDEDDGWISDTSNSFIVTCLYTFYTCMYYLDMYVTVCYNSQKTIGISDNQLQIAQAHPPMFKHLSSTPVKPYIKEIYKSINLISDCHTVVRTISRYHLEHLSSTPVKPYIKEIYRSINLISDFHTVVRTISRYPDIVYI